MHPNELRDQALQAALAQLEAAPQAALARAWLGSVEEEDLVGLEPEHLQAPLGEGFARTGRWKPEQGCSIEAFSHSDGRGGQATALLILNPDVPLLVDSIVMALRRLRLPTRAVLNAVLSVQRDAAGDIVTAAKAGSKSEAGCARESWVLCLMSELLEQAELDGLQDAIRMASGDAAAVARDAAAMNERMAAAGGAAGGGEAEAFLDWARGGGFECFGYAHYRAVPGQRELLRAPGSALGVLVDRSHPVYGESLAGIPGDLDTLTARPEALSVVKADVQSTLHRNQQLDFIGVRETDAAGAAVGEHCFVGLFSRLATACALPDMPFARGRIRQVLALAGVRPEGFRAEKFLEVMESLPRTEVLEAEPAWLARVCGAVVALYKQPRARVFARRDVYGRHLNVLVYLPRERYSGALAEQLAHTLRAALSVLEVRVHTLLADGPLARLYLIVPGADLRLDPEQAVQEPLLQVLEGWHNGFERLVDATAVPALRNTLRRFETVLPSEYVNAVSPEVAYRDLCMLASGGAEGRVRVRIESGGDEASIRLHSVERVPALSQILPALHNAGVSIQRERTHAIALTDGGRAFFTSLSIDTASAARLAEPKIARAAEELFEALFNDEAEDGRMNALVIEAGLRMREVQLVRAYASFWRQAGVRFSLRYMAERLKTQPRHVRTLVEAFRLRFDPERPDAERAEGDAMLAALEQGLGDVDHADTELILSSLAQLVRATVRTSYYQPGQGDTIVLKFASGGLALLPQPRPYREIYVFARRFEGVHLRGGPVARGGLRWSDRMEDYRTEVLGLVKAQMVKNAVIVPAGAKGGFVCKMVPKDAPREAVAAEGEAVYRLFIKGLLDVTDNRVQGNIVHPPHTVCRDDPDPYLVVAADKGTATFSDIANAIALERGFWLGDAFASGGSNGYDHKKLGITAKGAWEAVKRHFHELGRDLEAVPFTVVGIGDMSGDVFGNGMLLSRRIKLVAAFDHRHIFVDPDPDPGLSFEERARLFALPRSSWDDYDRSRISAGGGVWSRSARSISLSPQARVALGIEAEHLAPHALMHAILMAPVDLLYNGGIGTYVKASTESQEQAKDRANDAIRVDACQLRCRVVAEGGNLGVTQAGRVEYALAGGRIFTDAIDNSAGVDCSDHEVNLKIWLDAEVTAGQLGGDARNRQLHGLTGDVVALVLRDNALQTQLLVREAQGQHEPEQQRGYGALIVKLEVEGMLSRALERLPQPEQLAARHAHGSGLTTPELAVVIAHVKNRYKRLLSEHELLAHPWACALLASYFPPALAAGRDPLQHPLANTILATVLANEAVNRCGPLLLAQLAQTHAVRETEVLCAWAQAWSVLNLAPLFSALDAHALQVPPKISRQVDAGVRTLQRTAIDGVLGFAGREPACATLDELGALFGQPERVRALTGRDRSVPPAGLPQAYVEAADMVEELAGIAPAVFAAATVRRPPGSDLAAFLRLALTLRQAAGIDALEQHLAQSANASAQAPLRDHALLALRRAQQRLLEHALQVDEPEPALRAQAVIDRLQLPAHSQARSTRGFEQAVLDAWALSEAAGCA